MRKFMFIILILSLLVNVFAYGEPEAEKIKWESAKEEFRNKYDVRPINRTIIEGGVEKQYPVKIYYNEKLSLWRYSSGFGSSCYIWYRVPGSNPAEYGIDKDIILDLEGHKRVKERFKSDYAVSDYVCARRTFDHELDVAYFEAACDIISNYETNDILTVEESAAREALIDRAQSFFCSEIPTQFNNLNVACLEGDGMLQARSWLLEKEAEARDFKMENVVIDFTSLNRLYGHAEELFGYKAAFCALRYEGFLNADGTLYEKPKIEVPKAEPESCGTECSDDKDPLTITDEDIRKINEAISRLKEINEKYQTPDEVVEEKTDDELLNEIAGQLFQYE